MARVASPVWLALGATYFLVHADYTFTKYYTTPLCNENPIQVTADYSEPRPENDTLGTQPCPATSHDCAASRAMYCASALPLAVGCQSFNTSESDGPFSFQLTCTSQTTGLILLYSTLGCAGFPTGREDLTFSACKDAGDGAPPVGLELYQADLCILGSYTAPQLPVPYAQSTLFNLDSSPCVESPPFEDTFYPTVDMCFSDGKNSAKMSCNSTSTALVAESWTGLSCSGAPIATVSLVALNGACVNGSTSFCVTAANGVSQTITPSGTPSSSATSTVTATASVTAAVTSTSTVSRSVNPSPTASQTAAPNAMPRADVGAIVGATLGVLAAFVFFGVIVLRRRGYLTSMPTMAWLRYGTIPADERTGLSSGLVNPASSVSRPKTRAVYNVTVI